jgi:hypothetical protein
MRKRAFGLMVAVAAVLLASSSPRADDPPGGSAGAPKAPAAGGKPDDAKKDEAKKDQAVLRVERAKKLVAELEQAIVRAKAAQPIDADLLQRLMTMLEEAKALAKPAKPEELTAEEKKAVIEEAQKQAGADAGAKKGSDPGADMRDRFLARAVEGADLSEAETTKAGEILGEWWKENLASMGDSKKQSDLKRKRDDDLEKALGKKKAQKVINNVNSMGPGRR